MMVTIRELIQMMLLNCNLDDRVSVEIKVQNEQNKDIYNYDTYIPRRVFHMHDGEAVIECHDD